jgi:hypothetical protein
MAKKSLVGVKFMTTILRAKQTPDEKRRGSAGGYYAIFFL